MSGAGIFIISLLFNLYIWAILLRIILQIIRADYFNPLSQVAIRLTNYPCSFLDKFIPKNSVIDTSALVLLFLVSIIKICLLMILSGMSLGILGLITATICDLVLQLINLYFYLIIIVAIASWVAAQNFNSVLSVLQKITAPVLNPVRQIVPPIAGIDFSPLIALVLIKLVELFVLLPLLRMSGVA